MDTKRIGCFIAERRKQKGITQKELAQVLQVTDKAVSRWETGKGLPDTSLLKPLSEVLEVSVGELLSGKMMEEDDMKDQTERIILDALTYSRQMVINMTNLIMFLIGAALLISPLFLAGRSYGWMMGIALTGVALFRAYLRRSNKTLKLTDKSLYLLGIALFVPALILELLPIGAVLIFAPGPTETVRETYSYFSLILVGYAHFTPMLTGILTIACVLLGMISAIKYDIAKKWKNAVFRCSIIAAAASLAPLPLLGFDYMTPAGYAIFAAIVISICLQAIANRNIETPSEAVIPEEAASP